MGDENYSQITRVGLMKPLRDLLEIRGVKEVPEKIDVRDVKCVANIFDTWGGYESESYHAAGSIAGVNTITTNVLGPNTAGAAFLKDTLNKEVLILAFCHSILFDAAGAAAHAGFNNHFQLNYNSGFPNYYIMPHSHMEVDTQGSVLQYFHTSGGFNNMANNIPVFHMPLYPWLPEGRGIQLKLDSNANWPANTQEIVDILYITVPKYGKLPSL